MKALRALLTIVVFVLVIIFLFQNTWLQDSETLNYQLFTWRLVDLEVPIWGVLLLAFFIGYVLAWVVGRLDIIGHKNTARRARKQVAELEKALETERERNVQLTGERDRAAAAAAARTAPESTTALTTTETPASQPATRLLPAETSATTASPEKTADKPEGKPET